MEPATGDAERSARLRAAINGRLFGYFPKSGVESERLISWLAEKQPFTKKRRERDKTLLSIEWVGDAVLSLALTDLFLRGINSEYLRLREPRLRPPRPPGQHSRRRALNEVTQGLVSNSVLAKICERRGLDQLLGLRSSRTKADIMELSFGVVFLDAGFDRSFELVTDVYRATRHRTPPWLFVPPRARSLPLNAGWAWMLGKRVLTLALRQFAYRHLPVSANRNLATALLGREINRQSFNPEIYNGAGPYSSENVVARYGSDFQAHDFDWCYARLEEFLAPTPAARSTLLQGLMALPPEQELQKERESQD